MGPIDAVFHLLGFAAPALALAAMLPFFTLLVMGRGAAQPTWLAQFTVNAVACLGVLAAGLWFLGADGRMASYAVMVLVCASTQWCMLRGWRSG